MEGKKEGKEKNVQEQNVLSNRSFFFFFFFFCLSRLLAAFAGPYFVSYLAAIFAINCTLKQLVAVLFIARNAASKMKSKLLASFHQN